MFMCHNFSFRQQSVSPVLGAGYYAGGALEATGDSSPLSLAIDKLNFSTEVITTISATLSLGKYELFAAPSTVKGYFAGGNDYAASISNIDSLIFASSTCVTLSATLTRAKESATSVYSTSDGYFVGGAYYANEAYTYLSEIDRLKYASEAVSKLAATLSVLNMRACGAASSTVGYILGGSPDGNETQSNAIQSLVFSTEATSTLATVLSRNKSYAASVSSSTDGYVSGGSDANTYAEIERLEFSTNIRTLESSSLSTVRSGHAGSYSSMAGYFAGGWGQSVFPTNIESLSFTTKTVAVLSTVMPKNVASLAGLSGL